MEKQLQKLFVQQGGHSDIGMKYTENAFGLLLHALNIKDYQMSNDIVELLWEIILNVWFYIIIILVNIIT